MGSGGEEQIPGVSEVPPPLEVDLPPRSDTVSSAGWSVARSPPLAVLGGDMNFISLLGTLSVFAHDLPCSNVFITEDFYMNPPFLPHL